MSEFEPKPKEITIEITEELVEEYNKYYLTVLHPRAKKKPIESPYMRTLNKMLCEPNRIQANASKHKYMDFTSYIIEQEELYGLRIAKCKLYIQFFYPTKLRRDLDGNVAMLKDFLDACVENELLIDDSYHVVQEIHATGEYQKGVKKVILTFKDIKYEEEEQ